MIHFKCITAERIDGRKAIYVFENRKYSPEEFVVNYYNNLGFKSYWFEGRFWRMLYSGYYNNIIYKSVFNIDRKKGVTASQKEYFLSSIQEIKNISTRLIEKYRSREINKYFDLNFSGFHVDENVGIMLIYLIPIELQIAVSEFVLFNWSNRIINVNGMPDLIVVDNVSNSFFFCEVKSENDSIQKHQITWHNFISDLGYNVEIMGINHNLINKYKKYYNI
ncbi:MAG: VRR-NUC domain-containing protein [Brevinematales bacterium]|nr:VRR-NUC domain-containing protein [Brevinematales bacterium]